MTTQTLVPDEQTDIAPMAHAALVPAADSPMPVFTGAQMLKALTAYQELQKALDRSMPDQIMELDGRQFRKKGYWRAISVAFGLTVEPISERREVSGVFKDGRENFGHLVTYRATAPNGRSATGDGSCFAVEKARRFKCIHPEWPGSKRTLHFPHNTCPDFDPDFSWRALPNEATEHNVRSHAHTRAFNRAVSNLCGFGEVSAEEIDRDQPNGHAQQSEAQPEQPAAGAGSAMRVMVEDVRQRTGKSKAGKPFTKFVIVAGGREFGTFERDFAEMAKGAKQRGQMVEIDAKPTQYGLDILGMALMDREPGDEEPAL